MATKVIKDDVPLLMRALLALSREETVVGIPEDGGKHAGSDLTNAQIGYLMETGDPASNLPPRPTLGPGMDRAKPAIVNELRKGIVSALKDTAALKTAGDAMHAAHAVAGKVGRDAVRAEMRSGRLAPLASSTLRKRRAHGNGSDRPLIDTRELHDAVTFEVRAKR